MCDQPCFFKQDLFNISHIYDIRNIVVFISIIYIHVYSMQNCLESQNCESYGIDNYSSTRLIYIMYSCMKGSICVGQNS